MPGTGEGTRGEGDDGNDGYDNVFINSGCHTKAPQAEGLVSKRFTSTIILVMLSTGVQRPQVLGRVLSRLPNATFLFRSGKWLVNGSAGKKHPVAWPNHVSSDPQDPHDGMRELYPNSCPLTTPLNKIGGKMEGNLSQIFLLGH